MPNNKDKLNELNIIMPHGRVPQEVLEEMWALWNEDGDTELALKLAFASIEYALCGETNFNEDKAVMRELRRDKTYFEHNLESYQWKCDETVIEKRLDDIARMTFQEHKIQKDIAAALQIGQPEVSKRIKLIREKYPELVEKYSK